MTTLRNGDPCICGDKTTWHKDCYRRAALAAEPALPQPVAWVPRCIADPECGIVGEYSWLEIEETPFACLSGDWECAPLYAGPPQRRPLTDEQIDALLAHFAWRDVDIGEYTSRKQVAFARAIERAHGIAP